jgi:hypothetical protein
MLADMVEAVLSFMGDTAASQEKGRRRAVITFAILALMAVAVAAFVALR